MKLERFAWIASLTLALCFTGLAGQKASKATENSPAASQAKTHQPATHFTQGTIASIDADQLVLNRKDRGKTKANQATFKLDSKTQRNGNLVVGNRVSVQYREDNNEKIATAVREAATKSAAKPAVKSGDKPGVKPGSKS